MDENNHSYTLQQPFTAPITIANSRGRPKKDKVIRFSTQPKSIVSQILSKINSDECDLNIGQITQDCKNVQMGNIETEVDQKTELNCNFCSYRSEDAKEHKNHMKTHKQFACDFPNCTYSCKLSSNLTKHKRIHTGEKPYLCEQCSFRSNFINSLKVHKRTHTLERPYICKECSYRSNSSWNLKKHCYHRHLKAIKTT